MTAMMLPNMMSSAGSALGAKPRSRIEWNANSQNATLPTMNGKARIVNTTAKSGCRFFADVFGLSTNSARTTPGGS